MGGSRATCAILLVRLLVTCRAWGLDGHAIVAQIAESLLPGDVQAALRAALGNDTLSNASNWCDDYDNTPEGAWSMPLHYINYPGRACTFQWDRDCVNDFCNVGGLLNYSRQVFNQSLSTDERFFALKFILHLMGDLHQPLHVARHDDLGGNLIHIKSLRFSTDPAKWVDQDVRLHAVWDAYIVVEAISDLQPSKPARRNLRFDYHDWPLLANSLLQRLREEWHDASEQWREGITGPQDEAAFHAGLGQIAADTAALGCEHAYAWPDGSDVVNGSVLNRTYYLVAKPVVEEQLAKAGVRLAQLLTEVLAATTIFA